MGSIDEILAGYEALRPGQEAFYQDLHRHPELSHQEHDTARRVAERLRGDGLTVQTGIGGTGVVGVLANGAGPTVLLRCELDALPLREDTGAPYASTVTVQDAGGHEVPVDHACGHDMHMACMTTMAKLMADHRDQWQGTLITLFQPAEETGDRAGQIPRQTVSEDFSKIPDAVGVPYCSGRSGSPTGIPTSRPRRTGTWTTCPPTTPRNSCPPCSPPCEPEPRPWSRPRWPGSYADLNLMIGAWTCAPESTASPRSRR